MTGRSTQSLAASVAVAVVGAAWGIYWLPLRQLQAAGFGGEWATAWIFIACLPAALPLVFIARRELRAQWRPLIWLAFGNGAAFSLYSNAYAHTSVFNVLFLFYLSPVWSVLIVRFWQGERISRVRMGCVALGLTGLVAMLSADGGWPIPRNSGDWMALTVARAGLVSHGMALAHTHTFYEGGGCIECGGTGFKGRMAICELLDLSDHIRELILERRPISEIKRAAREEGMRFLRECAVERMMLGLTTLREINKVTFVE